MCDYPCIMAIGLGSFPKNVISVKEYRRSAARLVNVYRTLAPLLLPVFKLVSLIAAGSETFTTLSMRRIPKTVKIPQIQ